MLGQLAGQQFLFWLKMKRQNILLLLIVIFIPQVLVFIDLSGIRDDGFEPRVFESLESPNENRNFLDVAAEEKDGRSDAARLRVAASGGRVNLKRSVNFDTYSSLRGPSNNVDEKDGPVRWNKKVERLWFARLQNMTSQLFLNEMGSVSDSVCQLPALKPPDNMCRDTIAWECNMVPTFSSYNPLTRNLTINCTGRFRVNQVDRTEYEEIVARGSYRKPALWKYYQGPQEVAMETEYADVVCKNQKMQDLHNYHTQFLPKPTTDRQQELKLQLVKGNEPTWKPVSVLTVVLDSTSRAQAHRKCGLPKTLDVLKRYYDGYFRDVPEGHNKPLSHQSFFFNRLNAISSSTALNLTPLFSGQLYQDGVDMDKVTKGIYAKEIDEWIWQYASGRGYLTSYGVDNNSGVMGTRTHCKACHYRPPVVPHVEHGWQKRENEQVRPGILSGLCDGNHMLHEYILNYTRDFLRHPHPAKWAALDLNAGHRSETESVNQVDTELALFLEGVLEENRNLVVFILGDHGKPLHEDPSHLGSYYETLLPFLSIIMPTWILRERPDIMSNLIMNQQRYIVHADLHLSMKSLLHYPHLSNVDGAVASKAINIFTLAIPRGRSCEQADIPPWTCVCGFMQKLTKSQWTPRHTSIAQRTLRYINAMHSPERLSPGQLTRTGAYSKTTCMDLHLRRILNVLINVNQEETLGSARRYLYHVTFQTVEEDTVWSAVVDSDMNIKQVKQITLYQPYDVCWDRRVPLQFCVCDRTKSSHQTLVKFSKQEIR